ncbi:MAG: ethanolamine utilization protein EutJ [Nitriliruptor sp.]|nr:MAG: ethanolamine utilization protein EutJ [Nitriliruptor sp.]
MSRTPSPPGPLQPGLSAAELLEAARRAAEGSVSVVPAGRVHVGVDLGTAYVVVAAVDGRGSPLAVASRFATVVRDGVVVDFAGAIELVRELVAEVEGRLGVELTTAATTYPPGVAISEVRACRYVVEGAGLECTRLVDEPTAANAVLRIRDGAVVDVGGGTTGLAVLRDGEVVAVMDDATGGTHVSLVIAGHLGISLEEAEARKTDPAQQAGLFGVVRPVFDKIGTLVADHLAVHEVDAIHLVGGTAAFPGIADVIAERTGVEVHLAPQPLLVTPLGVALHDPGHPSAHPLDTLEVGHG